MEKLSSDFAVPDWYKSQMVNLVSKGKVRIELMVTGGRVLLLQMQLELQSWLLTLK